MKTVIVTGASKGIGWATANLFLEKASRVINISRTTCNLEGVEDALIDLAADDAEARILELAQSLETGEIHLVHNAAKLTNESVRDADTGEFRSVLEANVIAPQILNKAVLPKMKPGSSIIYIGSTLSEKGVPNSYSYVVPKHASVGMMRATC
ncbi:MAG: SDR family oxidoreductase, partial [Gammaproteobacteria bacterium]|nr:SDR family oxidoreductase [Gammaproteobacteria bacterium]